MVGVRTRIRGSSSSVAVSEDTSSTESQIADRDYRFRSANRILPIDRVDSLKGNMIDCSKVSKVSRMSWILGIVGPAALGKAVGILDTLGSSVANLKLGSSEPSSEISILAFEVAKTILKGNRLVRSFSGDNIQFLKTSVLSSKGVRTLVSEDADWLLRIAAADKREELESFLREVAHFGNRCKDAQWRNLDRYFEKLGLGVITPQMHLNADSTMQRLMTLVYHTAVLFSELSTLEKVEKEFRAKSLQEGHISTTVLRGDLANLTAAIKSQRKIIKSLQKKSLWSKSFEEIVEQLVCIAHFLLAAMNEAFGSADGYKTVESSMSNNKKLGPMALHYATIITQIDILGTLSSSAPSSMRDALYQQLPRRMRSALPKKLHSIQLDLECNQIKAEMDKTLHWLGPIARNTTNAFQGFGWSGGWANFESEVNQEVTGHTHTLKIETLYHADREKTEVLILELVVWLHYLIIRATSGAVASSSNPPNHQSLLLSVKDHEILENLGENNSKCGVSRSQNFTASKPGLSKTLRLAKSSRESSGSRRTKKDQLLRWPSCNPVIDFDIDRIKVLDVIDGLERV